ncbi:MAG TPA: ThiS family protein [Desulfobacteraceae bacterium]|nr:ThiS family protein [Desulfobacteraceae bacterium]|tara:strand:+ start:74 stop:343 length:270 start_codon:yes stop_codon:yes gene_type:complete
MITIHIPLILRHLSDDAETFQVEGSTVGQCLEELVKAFPGMQASIFSKKGEIHHLIEIFLNSKTAHPDELRRPTVDGDEIHVVTLLSGG